MSPNDRHTYVHLYTGMQIDIAIVVLTLEPVHFIGQSIHATAEQLG